jgi:hypothetical protein
MKPEYEKIAPCGIDCFNCELYFEKITPFWVERMTQMKNMSPENVPCKGCRTEKRCKFHEGDCDTYNCVAEKGVDFCFECAEFPCNRLQPLREGADIYPHNIKIFNLSKMKSQGIDAWLNEASLIREKYYKGKFEVGKGPVLSK